MQVFLDVVESVNLLVNSNGTVVRSEVAGALRMRTYLSGMPECKLGLNDKVSLLATLACPTIVISLLPKYCAGTSICWPPAWGSLQIYYLVAPPNLQCQFLDNVGHIPFLAHWWKNCFHVTVAASRVGVEA